MSDMLNKITIRNFTTQRDVRFNRLDISYQLFGQDINKAPLVLVVHALTGNSDVAGVEKGWWKAIIGKSKLIDTGKYTVLGFNIPGNTFDGSVIDNYKSFTAYDIAALFNNCLMILGVKMVYAALGGSLGGCIAWEMLAQKPGFFKYVIPVAADWKSTDWIIGQTYVQDKILQDSKRPIYDARMMAMLFYRTQHSMKLKFNRRTTGDSSLFEIESWLSHHGESLQKRFSLAAYKMMNHLLATVDISRQKGSFEEAVKDVTATIIQININSDLMFVEDECFQTADLLGRMQIKNHVYIIDSVHGHDAFLIEHEQITTYLKKYF